MCRKLKDGLEAARSESGLPFLAVRAPKTDKGYARQKLRSPSVAGRSQLRILALRPSLAAGLPLSVQSIVLKNGLLLLRKSNENLTE